jgi:hypothetical protein
VPAPIRVEIANPEALQRDTVLQIYRDSEGKLDSATALKI